MPHSRACEGGPLHGCRGWPGPPGARGRHRNSLHSPSCHPQPPLIGLAPFYPSRARKVPQGESMAKFESGVHPAQGIAPPSRIIRHISRCVAPESRYDKGNPQGPFIRGPPGGPEAGTCAYPTPSRSQPRVTQKTAWTHRHIDARTPRGGEVGGQVRDCAPIGHQNASRAALRGSLSDLRTPDASNPWQLKKMRHDESMAKSDPEVQVVRVGWRDDLLIGYQPTPRNYLNNRDLQRVATELLPVADGWDSPLPGPCLPVPPGRPEEVAPNRDPPRRRESGYAKNRLDA